MRRNFLTRDAWLLLFGITVATIIYLPLKQTLIIYPLFLFFNVLLTIQSTQKQTIDMSIKRIMGTVLGSIIGLIFYFSFPHTPWVVIVYVAVATFLSYFFLGAYIGIVGIIGIMLILDAAQGLPFLYVAGRLVGALFGVGISLATVYIFKNKKHQSFQVFCQQALESRAVFTVVLREIYENELSKAELEKKLLSAIKELRALRQDLLDEDNDLTTDDDKKILYIISQFADMYMHMRLINRSGGILDTEALTQLSAKMQLENIGVKKRMYENSMLLNLHTKRLLLLWEQQAKYLSEQVALST